MKIVAALAFYDEAPAQLEACIHSLAGAADGLVAIQTKWAHMPAEGYEQDER